MDHSKSTRRTFLAGMAALASAAVILPAGAAPENDKKTTTTGPVGGEKDSGPFALPALGYAFGALEPHIDAKTMEIHHDKHHAAYVDKLNAALKGHDDLSKKTIEDLMSDLNSLPEAIRNDVRNHGGGHLNHTMFWEIMTPGGAKEPGGDLAKAINAKFGSLDNLKKQLNEAGTKRFGSGWAWLVRDKSGELAVTSTPNQDTPVSDGAHPILGNDVWEHAYYLKYQNKRADYLAAWWNVVNWDKVAERFQSKPHA